MRQAEREISGESWPEMRAAGFRHFLNVAPTKLSEDEFLALIALAKNAAGDDDSFAFGAFFDDDLGKPVDAHCDLGLYVQRPEGWKPF